MRNPQLESYHRLLLCSMCNGDGYQRGETIPCYYCNGSGHQYPSLVLKWKRL